MCFPFVDGIKNAFHMANKIGENWFNINNHHCNYSIQNTENILTQHRIYKRNHKVTQKLPRPRAVSTP